MMEERFEIYDRSSDSNVWDNLQHQCYSWDYVVGLLNAVIKDEDTLELLRIKRVTEHSDGSKRFNVFDVDGTVFLEDHIYGSYHIGEIDNVDINCLGDIAYLLNQLADENERLKQKVEAVEEVILNSE